MFMGYYFVSMALGFLFALPAYIFLLPQMTHWLELAIFLFSYAFIGFYVFLVAMAHQANNPLGATL